MTFKTYQKELKIKTHKPFEFINITKNIQNEIEKSRISNGVVTINVLHTTAAIALQEKDTTVHDDSGMILEKLISINENYSHSYEGKINGAAHQRQQLIGSTCTIPIHNKELILGTWQQIFLIELFQPMPRNIFVTVIGEL